MKITPKRVQIELKDYDGQPIIRYVSPESLDMITPTSQNSRSQTSTETAGKDLKEDFSPKSTIFWQFLSGLLSLILGGVIISLITAWGNKFEVNYPDNSKNTFFVGAMFSSFGLIFLVVYTIKKQFEEAFTSIEAFRASIQYSFWGWVYVTILYTILMLIPLLFGDWLGFSIIIADTIFLMVTFMSIAIVIGGVQYFRLKVERFDVSNHRTLLNFVV